MEGAHRHRHPGACREGADSDKSTAAVEDRISTEHDVSGSGMEACSLRYPSRTTSVESVGGRPGLCVGYPIGAHSGVVELSLMRLLFLCDQNRFRSPTAAALFSMEQGIETASAGVGRNAVVSLTEDLVAWADLIFVMEKAHYNRLLRRFRHQLPGKRVVVLDIPDEYDYMEPELVDILKHRVRNHIPPP